MKIDLHCHTKSVKQGDGTGRNVTVDVFKEKIANADIKIVAITNHNAFDYEQYCEFKEAVQEFCQVWPGIEIDINGKNGKYHLLVVANPDNSKLFSERTEKMFVGKNIETCKMDIADVYASLSDCDVIYIPHFHKKPEISQEDYDELLSLVNDDARVFSEPQNLNSLGVFANHNYNVIIGSDVRDWNQYENSSFAELKLPVECFTQFYLLSKKDTTVVNTLLNKKGSHKISASPHKTVKFDLTIYKDINVIFGQKGTGKSEILESLYNNMVSKGIKCSKYKGSDKESEFQNILKTTDMQVDLKYVDADDCEDDFKGIFNWCDYNPTLFSQYIKWYETRDNSRNKSRMKITDSSTLIPLQIGKYSIHKEDYSTVNTIVRNISSINLTEYVNEECSEQLEILLSLLQKNIRRVYSSDLVNKHSTELANFSINIIKQIADKNSNSVSKPSTTGFKEFAIKRLELSAFVTNIYNNISDKSSSKYEYLGELDGKGKIYISKLYRMLTDKSKTDEFVLGIRVLRDAKDKLLAVSENITSSELPKFVENFATHCSTNKITSSKDFLGRSKIIVAEDHTEYTPSNGEKGILMLQKNLRDDADAYFLDEPELGMGNSYVNNIIRPQIIDLAKRNKMVVVATHNANIAVCSLPYASIFRTHINGTYRTYVGNPFNDQLVNIDDDSDVKSWSQESMYTLEGGKEAFYERKYIYESSD